MSSGWCTIESDPGVFTELISEIGVKGVQVDEVYTLDKETLDALSPVYGLIFLFKWQKEGRSDRTVLPDVPGLFFAKQVVSNACATQAIISVLLNREEIDLGPTLTEFKSFAGALDSETRGLCIGQSDPIRIAHNSFARPEPFIFESKAATEDDDVYHFIGYVPKDGNLYELDGLQEGPILLGQCDMDNWLEVARPAIEQRFQKYSQKEIRFSLLALVQNRKEVYTTRLNELTSAAGAESEEALELQEKIKDEETKFENWKIENIRRKHNYVPFLFSLLQALAAKGELKGLVDTATKVGAERREKAAKAKQQAKEE
jgi:ubiquitin carboxyl-terminal hydrolase L5